MAIVSKQSIRASRIPVKWTDYAQRVIAVPVLLAIIVMIMVRPDLFEADE